MSRTTDDCDFSGGYSSAIVGLTLRKTYYDTGTQPPAYTHTSTIVYEN